MCICVCILDNIIIPYFFLQAIHKYKHRLTVSVDMLIANSAHVTWQKEDICLMGVMDVIRGTTIVRSYIMLMIALAVLSYWWVR